MLYIIQDNLYCKVSDCYNRCIMGKYASIYISDERPKEILTLGCVSRETHRRSTQVAGLLIE